jgi:serine/threonine protein kinase
MATLTVNCTACGKSFTVPDHYAGRAGKCTKCGAPMTVPAAGAPPSLNPAMLASEDQMSEFEKAPAPAAAKPVSLGNSLAGYKLLKKLGDAKSMVVLADAPTGGNVALKVLPAAVVAKSPTAAKRFLRESRSLFGLAHPNVVSLLDAGEDVGSYYLAMEYFEGRPLRDVISEKGKVPEPEALKLARQVASGIGHLEKHKLVHRNVRPEHILVNASGAVKIVGLGLVRSAEEDDSAPVTMQGMFVGVPQYMAPECATGQGEVDSRADFFSLGVTLYEMLAGQVPWTDKSPLKTLQMIRTAPPPPLLEKNPGVSPATALVVEKLLSKDPAARYQSAGALVSDLEAIERLELVDGKPPSFVAGGAPKRAAANAPAAAASSSNDNDALVKKLVALVAVLVVLVLIMMVALIVLIAKK